MKTKIENIDDIIAERVRLKNQLQQSKAEISRELAAIKTEFNPARQAVGFIGDVFATPKKGLLSLGVGLGVDTIIRRGLLARAGWITKLVVPFLVRNVATNLISKNRTSLVENGLIWLKNATAKPNEKSNDKKEPTHNRNHNRVYTNGVLVES